MGAPCALQQPAAQAVLSLCLTATAACRDRRFGDGSEFPVTTFILRPEDEQVALLDAHVIETATALTAAAD
jgi:hypothetical protein